MISSMPKTPELLLRIAQRGYNLASDNGSQLGSLARFFRGADYMHMLQQVRAFMRSAALLPFQRMPTSRGIIGIATHDGPTVKKGFLCSAFHIGAISS